MVLLKLHEILYMKKVIYANRNYDRGYNNICLVTLKLFIIVAYIQRYFTICIFGALCL